MNSLTFVGKFPVDNEEHVIPERSSHSHQGSSYCGRINCGGVWSYYWCGVWPMDVVHGDYLRAEDDIDDLQIIRVVRIQMELHGKSHSHENVIEVWIGATRHDSLVGIGIRDDHSSAAAQGDHKIASFGDGVTIVGEATVDEDSHLGKVIGVEENRAHVGKDKDIAIEGQMEEGIEVVLDYGVGSGLAMEGQVVHSLTGPLNMVVPPTKMMRLFGRI
ncbi:hypothetical protein SUGI_0714920 [Cryptomeria japonica]|nr:hypothetical protein SUGI_0714920 [Cryptomeria japonica]